MIRKTKARRYNYGRKPEPPPKEEDTSTVMEKVKRLPLPGPGIVIRIPLHLYLDYMAYHGLDEVGYRGDTMFYARGRKERTNEDTTSTGVDCRRSGTGRCRCARDRAVLVKEG